MYYWDLDKEEGYFPMGINGWENDQRMTMISLTPYTGQKLTSQSMVNPEIQLYFGYQFPFLVFESDFYCAPGHKSPAKVGTKNVPYKRRPFTQQFDIFASLMRKYMAI